MDLKINGKTHSIDVEGNMPLLWEQGAAGSNPATPT